MEAKEDFEKKRI